MSETDLEQINHKSDAVFTARNIESGYGDLKILNGVDIDVQKSEIVLIFGPNGAGKSTFIKTLYGVLPVWDGKIEFNGEDITNTPAENMIDNDICYVPQRENVFANLTVEENLDLGGIHRSDSEKGKQMVLEYFPDLEDKLDTNAGDLSGGQRQMLAMGRALMIEPDMMIIDEPSAGLAPQIVDEMFGYVKDINEAGTTILMIEQNIKEGLKLSDRGYALHNGDNAYEGDADELLKSEQIRELYLGG